MEVAAAAREAPAVLRLDFFSPLGEGMWSHADKALW